MEKIVFLFLSFIFLNAGGVGFLANQKYVCMQIGLISGNKIIPIMTKEESLNHPSRFYIDNKRILHTDSPNYPSYQYVRDNIYVGDKEHGTIKLIIENNKRYMIKTITVKMQTGNILYGCVETDNWTLR